MKQNTEVKIKNLVISVSLILLLFLGFTMLWLVNQKDKDANWIKHTQLVLTTNEQLFSNFKDAQSGFREFLLTDKVKSLEQFHLSIKKNTTLLSKFCKLTSDNPSQQKRCTTLGKIIVQKQLFITNSIDLLRKNKAKDKTELTFKGKEIMARARILFQQINGEEQRLLIIRNKKAARSEIFVSFFLAAGILLVSSIFLFLHLRLQREVKLKNKKELELTESKEWYNQTLSSVGDGVIAIDTDGIITFINQKANQLTGFADGEALGQHVDLIVRMRNEHSKNKVTNPAIEAIDRDEIVFLASDTILIKKDRTEIFIDHSGSPIHNRDNKIIGAVLIFRDITKNKTAENKTKNLLKELSNLQFSINQSAIIATTDLEGNIKYVNDKFCELSQYQRHELLGQNHRIINSGFHSKAFFVDLWETISNGNVWSGEIQNKSKDGTFYWVDCTITPLMDEEGKLYEYMSIRSQITERKMAQEKVVTLNNELNYLFNNINDAMYSIDAATKQKIQVSAACEQIFGYKPIEFMENFKLWEEVIHPDDKAIAGEIRAKLYSGENSINTYRIIHKEKGTRWIENRVNVTLDSNGKISRFDGIASDITDKKLAEEQRQRLFSELQTKSKEITDSIVYAKRIQNALLPDKDSIDEAFPQNFILYKPKAILSGDFYYLQQTESYYFIALADCTGHGVPGALMSFLGYEKLNDAIKSSHETSEILKLLNTGIKSSLHQSGNIDSTKDGMDISLCSADKSSGIVKYTGANRPLWIIRSGHTELEEIKGTRSAIGGFTEENQDFETHEIKLNKGDTFYMFSDGYLDQFGGERGKKLNKKQFKELLISIQNLSMEEQGAALDQFISEYRKDIEQTDDILVMGIKM